ncbi:predicted protein [Postia placenta Mad-698-R]|nr:predicted protein [Postia placenta Mad-698-R]
MALHNSLNGRYRPLLNISCMVDRSYTQGMGQHFSLRNASHIIGTGSNFGYVSSLIHEQNDERELTELEDRVNALKEVVASEESTTEIMSYSEDELLRIYEDLLAPTTMPSVQESQPVLDPRAQEKDSEAVRYIAERLLESDALATSSTSTLSSQEYRPVITRLQEIASSVETLRLSVPTFDSKDKMNQASPAEVPIGLLTNAEWSSLTRTCVAANDGNAAEAALDVMKRFGASNVDECAIDVLSLHASAGDVASVEQCLQKYAAPSLTDVHRDLHVKAHAKATPPTTFPTSTLDLLHHYEALGTPAPQKSYTRAITSLLSTQSRPAQGLAQAWDLFAHMRYVAHPQPDVALYTLMLRACSHRAVPAEPERALDLFTEMVVDRQLTPTPGAYAAAAYAFARSGERRYVQEAFRLAKEMLDANRDARGRSAFAADRRLFGALLEGAKRIGDLTRTRWILAEMVREMTQRSGEQEVLVNDLIMTHVFHAYAAFKPPFKRSATLIVDEQAPSEPPSLVQAAEHGQPPGLSRTETGLPLTSQGSRFSHIPPQSRGEVAREAKLLFTRIVEDTRAAPSSLDGDGDSIASRPFRHVQLTPRLLNAYLSVHYVHSSFDEWSGLYRTLFDELDVPRNPKTYVEALERCAISQKSERRMALMLADEIWVVWQGIEEAWRTRDNVQQDEAIKMIDARLVERANAAMIRILALLTSTVNVPDDSVPPLLTFNELEVLHHRLLAVGDRVGLGYLKWLCKAYENFLRERRDATMRAIPEGSDSEKPDDVSQPSHES